VWTLGALRARPWTVLDILAMLCKQVVTMHSPRRGSSRSTLRSRSQISRASTVIPSRPGCPCHRAVPGRIRADQIRQQLRIPGIAFGTGCRMPFPVPGYRHRIDRIDPVTGSDQRRHTRTHGRIRPGSARRRPAAADGSISGSMCACPRRCSRSPVTGIPPKASETPRNASPLRGPGRVER
jgi:hypothetical protein